ncbi:type VI secretion system baseplate subunit TssG [Campylobacter concisus]
MGLLGSGSHLTSYILEKISKTNDNSYELFFDFFDNYLLWLFFDSISLKNYARSFEDELDDKISKILLDMLNIKEKQLAKKFLPFSPLAVSQRRPKKRLNLRFRATLG